MRLEHDGARGGGARALRTQADLLALQLLECLLLRSGVNIERTDQQLGDIIDPLFDVSHPACFLAELEGIDMGDGRIDALEIQEVVDVLIAGARSKSDCSPGIS